MKDIKIYTTQFCGFCYRVKALISSKGIAFDEIDVSFDKEKREMMARLAGSTSVPQIFVDGYYLGDCEAVVSLDEEGKLDEKLGILNE